MASILLIHDDELVGTATRMMLERAGHTVHGPADGATGLRTLQDGGTDLVIAKSGLTNPSGISLEESVRAVNGDVPIVLTCAPDGPSPASQRTAERTGAAFVKTPFSSDVLIREVTRRLGGSRT